MQPVRALLLTDVVDSTQLSQRLGDRAMAALWAAHDRLAREACRRLTYVAAPIALLAAELGFDPDIVSRAALNGAAGRKE